MRQSGENSWPKDWKTNLFVESGPPVGRPLLFFSGMGVSAYPLRPIADALESEPVHVMLSSFPMHTGEVSDFAGISLEKVLAAGAAALEQAAGQGGPVLLGGYSSGGLLAMCLAARRPELVRALFLVGYCPRLSNFRRRIPVKIFRFLDALFPERSFIHSLRFRVKESGPAELMTAPYFSQPRLTHFPVRAFAVLSQLQDAAEDARWNVKVPVHFFHGRHDRRSSVAEIEPLATLLGIQGSPKPRIYENSPHCLMFGPEAERFGKDFVDAVRTYL